MAAACIADPLVQRSDNGILSWILPLTERRNISVRVRNFETNHLKVNDADGNPVEIAAIVVWQVADTSRALFAVDDYLNFVRVQAAHVEVLLRREPEGAGECPSGRGPCRSGAGPLRHRSIRAHEPTNSPWVPAKPLAAIA